MLHENNEENVWLNQLYWGEGSLEAVLFDIIHASNKYLWVPRNTWKVLLGKEDIIVGNTGKNLCHHTLYVYSSGWERN